MKNIFVVLFCFLVNGVTAQDSTFTKFNLPVAKYIIARGAINEERLIKLTPELTRILLDSNSECIDGVFTDSAVNNSLFFPDPGQELLLVAHNKAGEFTFNCTGSIYSFCPKRDLVNPRSPFDVSYGHCFNIRIGRIRSCQTNYGWRVEGDFEKNGVYESVLVIIRQ